MIYKQCGISLSSAKHTMVSTRLAKRLRALKMSSFEEYYQYLKHSDGSKQEITHLVDAITTNETSFFREKKHFKFLREHALPELREARLQPATQAINIWSAGCSTGEEPYTIAMILDDFFQDQSWRISILATDISTRVLSAAKRAVYPSDKVKKAIPQDYMNRYMMVGKGAQLGNLRVVPELRRQVTFERVNLMDYSFGIDYPMDMIFCRNVTIYFDTKTKIELFKKFYNLLHPGGYFFIGHSETLNRLNNDFEFVAPTIYRKPSLE